MKRINTVSLITKLITHSFLFAATVLTTAHAGGIGLGATRIIYPQGDKQISLPITNSSQSNAFLVQSWVANADQSKSTDFIVTPPLFVMHPKKENTIRIMYAGPDLPKDRESVFISTAKLSRPWIKVSCREIHCRLRRRASLSFLFAQKNCLPRQLTRQRRCAARSVTAS